MKQPLLICADDFGMSASINDGILELLKHKKISAVSCMTNQPYWEQDAPALISFLNQAKIGLHFNLPYPSLGVFILRSYMGLLNKKFISEQIEKQYNNFIKKIGRPPDFIDGHQHIHQLPIIRNCVITFYQTHYPDNQGFIRSTHNHQKNCFKATLINLLGGRHFKQLLQKNNIPHNKNFSGIYNLSEKNDYHLLFLQFMKDLDGEGLMMCHPANHADTPQEFFRVNEFKTLIKQCDYSRDSVMVTRIWAPTLKKTPTD